MNSGDRGSGSDTQVSAVLAPEQPRKLTLAEFKKLFSGHGVTPAVLKRVTHMGIIEVHGLSVRVMSPRLLEIGLEMLRIGVPMGEMLDQLEDLRKTADTAAAGFISVYERNMWKPFVAAGLPASQVEPLSGSLDRLTSLATDAVDVVARQALRLKAGEFLARQTREFGNETAQSRIAPIARAVGLEP